MYIDDIRADTELLDVARLFFDDDVPVISLEENGKVFTVNACGIAYKYNYSDDLYAAIPNIRQSARLKKIALYDALKEATGKIMPWGALTGVRPSKLFYELLRNGKSTTEATQALIDIYRVREDRACILRRIEYAQRGKVNFPDNYINLYIHVPYCTTRCSYCSFVSEPVCKNAERVQKYVELLCREIKYSIDAIQKSSKRILSVYIGGGTPTSLSGHQLDSVLGAIGRFDGEYTCEAGRPDTINDTNCDILKSHGVNRVCVNPQTLSDRTLGMIGRSHTAEEFFRAYEIVDKRGFDINCDLIAGLGDENVDDFAKSFEGVKSLSPENITVHSLSKKNGSGIRYISGENASAADMVEYALSSLGKYRPYYLYRQKRQACNLENIGFSLKGKECVNNITTMEETVGVMACGAGAISKFMNGGKINRHANLRDVKLYIENFDERLKLKLDNFLSCE